WIFIEDSWQWSTTPTPGAANIMTSAPASADKAATKKAAVPTAKKAAAKTTSPKSKKTGATGTSSNDTTDPSPTDQPPALHPAVLAGVGGAALLYGAYEYKADVANRFYQLRRYRATRRATRAAAKGA